LIYAESIAALPAKEVIVSSEADSAASVNIIEKPSVAV
jgi:hypothetical protein